MLDGLRVLRRSWRPFFQDMFYLAMANLAWAVLAFFILPLPAATAALFYIARRVARDEIVRWSDVWPAVRPHLGLIYRLGVVNALVYLILVYDIWFYAPAPGLAGVVLRAAPVALLVFWTVIQLNMFPVLFESDAPRFWPLLRDAARLIVEHPGFYLVIYLYLLVPAAISTLLIFPWFIVTTAYIALVLNTALLEQRGFYAELDRRQAEQERKRRMQGDE